LARLHPAASWRRFSTWLARADRFRAIAP
jgi:hypothetical protein